EPRGRVPDDFLRTPFRHRRAYNPREDPKLASFWRRVEDGEIEEDESDRRYLYQAAGTLALCHEGCGILHVLAVTGPSRGQLCGRGWRYVPPGSRIRLLADAAGFLPQPLSASG